MTHEKIRGKRPVFLGFLLDKLVNYAKIVKSKALTELSLFCGHEREGTVGALGTADRQATPEQTPMRGTAHPRYRMN